jgi:hypothetical protein
VEGGLCTWWVLVGLGRMSTWPIVHASPCPPCAVPVRQSWPRGTGSVGDSVGSGAHLLPLLCARQGICWALTSPCPSATPSVTRVVTPPVTQSRSTDPLLVVQSFLHCYQNDYCLNDWLAKNAWLAKEASARHIENVPLGQLCTLDLFSHDLHVAHLAHSHLETEAERVRKVGCTRRRL